MGVNSLISWTVIDPVMRVVITETWALSLAFCRWLRTLLDASFELYQTRTSDSVSWDCTDVSTRASGSRILVITEQLGRTFQPSRLGIVLMLRRRLHALCLGIIRVAIISPASGVLNSVFWWLILSDFWTVYNGLDSFVAFPFSLWAMGAVTAVWGTFFLSEAISVVWCFEEMSGYWMGIT